VCNKEISCVLTVTTRNDDGTTSSPAGACERPMFDQYTVISLVILFICVIYVRFVIHTRLHLFHTITVCVGLVGFVHAEGGYFEHML